MRHQWLQWVIVFSLVSAHGVHAAGADGAAVEENSNDRSPLGINLAGVVDWSPEMVFVDVFKHSRAWISQQDGQPWGKGPELELTPEGWVRRLRPGQYATTLLCVGGGHPTGRYVCLYDGTGRLEFQGNARVLEQSPGRIELEVSPQESMMLHLRETDPSDPVRNIRVIMPGFEETYAEQPFYPPFLERWRPFRVIRFMDWMQTNNSEIRQWSERPRPEHASQAIKGVALEYMIELCNELKTDPWFCMPHVLFSSVSRPSKWGSWGLLESENQDPATAPKYQAALEFLQRNEVWWK